MKQVARVTDTVACTCSCKDCSPCPPGIIIQGSLDTFVNNLQVARVTDNCSNCCGCCCPCPNPIIQGSLKTFVNNLQVARILDLVVCGFITSGSFDTYVDT